MAKILLVEDNEENRDALVAAGCSAAATRSPPP